MNEIAAVERMPVPVEPPAAPAPVSILAVIERAARDPNVDVDKMERLMAMHERVLAKTAEAAFNAALSELQPKLPVITENGTIRNSAGKVQSKYALWEDVVAAVTPLLGEYGFALSFKVGRDGDRLTVTGILRHRDGHSEETTLSLPIDASGSKNNVQGVGSSVSYGKRYTTQALLNLVSRGEDDDGHLASNGNETISAEQKETLVKLMKETNADTAKFLGYMGVGSLDEIKAVNFQKAMTALEAKRKKTNAPA
jgi:hypothetical protein